MISNLKKETDFLLHARFVNKVQFHQPINACS